MKKKRIKRTGLIVSVILLIGVVLSGCKTQETQQAAYFIYYLNQDQTAITSQPYEMQADERDTEAVIKELISQIEQGTSSVEYQKVYTESVELVRYVYEGNQLYLYFNNAYGEMPVSFEVLCRGAIVHTMLQVKGVSGVSFYVDNRPLCDINGKEVGVMTQDSFIDNPGEEINDIKVADLKLYFASLDGKSLVSENQHVYYYSSNISNEKLVMEQLLEGPVSENAQSAIPANTKLLSVSVMDGACIVNLDENFMTQNYDIQEEVVIYSIVNSLMELPNVNTVQISVNGETNKVYRQKMSLKDSYSMNLDLVRGEGDDVEVEQPSKQEKDKMDGGNLLNAGL